MEKRPYFILGDLFVNGAAGIAAALASDAVVPSSWHPLAAMPLVAGATRLFAERIHRLYEKVQQELARLSASAQENLAGVRVVRAYGQERQAAARFAEANQEYLLRSRDLIKVFGSLYPGIQLLMGAGRRW